MIVITAAVIRALSDKERPALVAPLVAAMNEFFPEFDITTEKRIEHFLAQACHESDGFKTLTEYASGDAYDTRTDLGNTAEKDGDGRTYKGRGIFQTTGRTNYAAAGKKMGLDLVNHPELLAEPRNAVWSACIYWQSRKLNTLADKDDLRAITKKINGGFNGLEDRRRYLDRARSLIKETAGTAPDDPLITPDSPRELVRTLQKLLAAKNYQPGGIDGKWGRLTRDAVMAMKADNGLDPSVESILLSQAKAAGTRVIETRVDATVADLRANGSNTVKGADAAQIGGAVTLAGTGAGMLAQAEEASGTAARIRGIFEPFQDLLPWIAAHWWVVIPAAACGGIYLAHRSKQKRLAEFKAGKMG